jgi:hypothetical protein
MGRNPVSREKAQASASTSLAQAEAQ